MVKGLKFAYISKYSCYESNRLLYYVYTAGPATDSVQRHFVMAPA
jgi:hypothetical protein